MRQWMVVSGLVVRDDGLLLVANRRRSGTVDWSPPGGVVDGGEPARSALTREVAEETGLEVPAWQGPLYEVRVEFGDQQSLLRVEVYEAVSWSGELTLQDPDGIVFEAAFCDPAGCRRRLACSPAWVADPLQAWLDDPAAGYRRFDYRVVAGRDPGSLVVERA